MSTNRLSKTKLIFSLLCFPLLAVGKAEAATINLLADGITGTGSYFSSAGNAETLSITTGGYTVVLSGGTPLGPNIANLPGNDSIAYGTNNTYTQGTGYTNPVTISFYQAGTLIPEGVTNFFLNLYNGNTVNVNYTLADNLGNGEIFNIGNNFSGGQQTFGFASTGNSFTVEAGATIGGIGGYDFFINDIGFNQALPSGSTNGGIAIIASVPEPEEFALLLLGLPLLGWSQRRKSERQVSGLTFQH
jgi:hypothetical protein